MTKMPKGPLADAVLDPVVRSHQVTVERLRRMTAKEAFDLAVDAGIFTRGGKLTPPYRSLSQTQSGRFTTMEKAKATPRTKVVQRRKKKGG